MSETALPAQIRAAQAYEALFVPALFGQWATKVADAAQPGPGDHALDVACGTGVLAREIANRVAASGHVCGLDSHAGMLEVAKGFAPEVDWREGTAEALPFPDASFDLVVSQFGLMFFADRTQALREMLRVLTPEGGLVVAVWDALDNIPAYASAVELLQRSAGEAAADALRAPFVLGERADLAALFAEAGATSVEIKTQPGTAQFPSIRVMVEADLRGWLPVMGVNLSETKIAHILEEAEDALHSHKTPEGRVSFDLSAHIVSARKP